MVVACGLSSYNVALFHLTTHAFFKALLFLTAGSIIHALNDEQDIRKMGGLYKILPISFIALFIGSLALIGFPFLSGYYSKDLIIELIYVNSYFVSYNFYFILVLSAFFTTFYSFRLIYWVFLTSTNISRGLFKYILESSWIICIVLLVLIYSSIFGGFFLYDYFVGLGTTFFNKGIFILPKHYTFNYIEFLPVTIKLIPFFVGILGIIFCWSLYFCGIYLIYYLKIFLFTSYIFLIKKWYFDLLYNFFISNFFFMKGYFFTYLVIDKGFLEFFGPYGLTNLITFLSKLLMAQANNRNQLQYFFLIILMFLVTLFFFSFLI
jgi:NADH-ubiquinone oxidoreductase chain 5